MRYWHVQFFFCCGSSKLLRQLTIRSIKTIFRFTKCVCVCVWCVQRDFSMLTAELCMCARCYTCFKVWYVRDTQLRAGTIVAIEIQDNSGSNQKSNEIFVALTWTIRKNCRWQLLAFLDIKQTKANRCSNVFLKMILFTVNHILAKSLQILRQLKSPHLSDGHKKNVCIIKHTLTARSV